MSDKTNGILIPAFSACRKGDLGIGDTLALRNWIDWASDHQIGFLQLLPINENGCDESPYSSISSIALDPIYLSFSSDHIPFLSDSEVEASRASIGFALSSKDVQYLIVRAAKNRLLEISFSRFQANAEAYQIQEFQEFRDRNLDWLPDYCLFKFLAEWHGRELTWDFWPEDCRQPDAARAFVGALRKENPGQVESQLDYFAYIQWLCFKQWKDLRAYADTKSVKLMGDLPIGVSFHSADVFFHRNLFLTDCFCGTPPEGYSAENPFLHEWGQNWGVPVYDWKAHAESGFHWWRQRIAKLTEIFNIYRIDHILGFYRIYGFPWHPRRNSEFLGKTHQEAEFMAKGSLPRWFDHPDDSYEHKQENLRNGDFRLRAILDAGNEAEIIAEDLGWVPEYVRPHLDELGISGYRIPHWDSYADGSPVLGDVFPKNSFATFSTHDHDSLIAIWEACRKTIKAHHAQPTVNSHAHSEGAAHTLRLLAGFSKIPIPQQTDWPVYSDAIHWRLIISLLRSNSRYVTFLVTDLFEMTDRINTPGSSNDKNWRLRVNLEADEMAARGRILANLIHITGR